MMRSRPVGFTPIGGSEFLKPRRRPPFRPCRNPVKNGARSARSLEISPCSTYVPGCSRGTRALARRFSANCPDGPEQNHTSEGFPRHRHSWRPRAQPQERRRRNPARPAGGVHRPVRLGQVVARLRHDLCRGPAPLCREPVGLCPAIPGDDAEAGRRPDRRPVACDLYRAEDHLQESALDGRHRHRDLRLHAAAVGAGRRALFAGHRPADREPDHLADGRPRARVARRHPHLRAGAGGARPQGRVPQGARRIPQEGLPARQGRRRLPRDRRGQAARQEIHPRHRRGGRPPGGAERHRHAARGFARAVPQARRGPRHHRAGRHQGERRHRQSRPQRQCRAAHLLGEIRLPGVRLHACRKSSRGCSRSTIRSAPARNAAASA